MCRGVSNVTVAVGLALRCVCLLLDGCNLRRGLNHTDLRDSSESDNASPILLSAH